MARVILHSDANSFYASVTLLHELKELHKDGIVDDEVFQAKKGELLKRL